MRWSSENHVASRHNDTVACPDHCNFATISWCYPPPPAPSSPLSLFAFSFFKFKNKNKNTTLSLTGIHLERLWCPVDRGDGPHEHGSWRGREHRHASAVGRGESFSSLFFFSPLKMESKIQIEIKQWIKQGGQTSTLLLYDFLLCVLSWSSFFVFHLSSFLLTLQVLSTNLTALISFLCSSFFPFLSFSSPLEWKCEVEAVKASSQLQGSWWHGHQAQDGPRERLAQQRGRL